MKQGQSNRRKFIKLTATATGMGLLSGLSNKVVAGLPAKFVEPAPARLGSGFL
jgi:hypothetical protein